MGKRVRWLVAAVVAQPFQAVNFLASNTGWKARATISLLLVLLLAAALAWWVVPWLIPLPNALAEPREVSPTFLASDGSPLRQLLTSDGEHVQPLVPFAEITRHLVSATLAAEDKRFFHHGGVDPLAISRAAWDNATARRVVSGASTIHQQLVKVTARRPGKRTLGVKLVEALQARRLAMSWQRERVLEEYLHRISYGNLTTGCAAAASGYFNKPLNDLTPAECALLAAIPQSPRRLNPLRDLNTVRPRQLDILEKMKKLGWLSAAEWQVAIAEPLSIQRFTGGFTAPHAVDLIANGHSAQPAAVHRTTLNARLQRQVEKIIAAHLSALQSKHVTQAAAVIIDNRSGHVLTMAGSRDFFSSDGGQINGAWTPHSPGSAIKPFTYLIAFERGATPATIVADLPIEFGTSSGTYRPENYARRIYGPITYRAALGNSLNISAVRVLASIGGAATLLAKLQSLGITTLTEPSDYYGLGLTIGNAPVRLIELTNAYACLARLGIDKPWTLLANSPAINGVRQFDEAACYLIADILSDNQARLLTFGANSPLRLPFALAAKTGTSQNYRDNWAVGYTPEFTVGVWAGNFDNTPMQEVSGVTGAAPILREVFLHLNDLHGLTWFAQPKNLVTARIDPRTGKRLTPQSPPARLSRDELFRRDNLPPPATSADYDSHGRAFLAAEYAHWAGSADNWLGDLVTARPENASTNDTWRIANPVPGTVIHLDPDIPGSGGRLILETQPVRAVEWHSDTLKIQQDDRATIALLVPGRHTLTAHDRLTGAEQKTFVIVHPE